MKFLEIYKTVSKKEWLFVSIFTLLVIVITLIPPLFAYFQQPEGKVYVGIHYQNTGDWDVYYSYIEQVKQGHFLLINSLTSEIQGPVFFNPVWIIPGLLARYLNLSSIVSFQITRIICIPVFTFFAYIFLSYFFKDRSKRQVCFLLLLFAGGFGEYSMLADGFTFLTLNFSPHLIIALILMILSFLFLLLSWENNLIKYSILAGIFSFILFLVQPFVIPIIYLAPFVFIFINIILNKKNKIIYLKHYIIFFIASLPSAVYYLFLVISNSAVKMYQVQNTLLSPSLWQYFLAYGFLTILTIIGFKPIIYSKENKNYFIVVWFAVNVLLLYGPFNFQKRLVEGLHVPIVLISTYGLFYLYFVLKKIFKRDSFDWIIKSFLFWLCLVLLPWSSLNMLAKNIYFYPAGYLDKDQYEAIIWLKKETRETDIILSTYHIGNVVAGQTGRQVYLGHGIQTINSVEKIKLVEWFYGSDDDILNKIKFLKDNKIDYIFYGEGEKKFGGFNPENLNNLKRVYNNGETSIFKVINI